MAARLKSNVPRMKVLAREDAANLLNQGASAHVTFSQLVVPIKTRALYNTIKQADEATPQNLRTKVTAGEGLDYGVPVELGFRHYKSGLQIPGQFFFRQGLELGQQRLANHKVRLG